LSSQSIYLVPPTGDTAQPPVLVPPADPVAADYGLAERVGTKEAWEAFLMRHGQNKDSFYVQLAEAALKKLAVGIFPTEEEPKKQEPAPKAEKTYEPGDTFRDCDDCPEMVVLPGGTFTMGSPLSEKGWSVNESPQHQVTISQPFAVGRFEVTFAEWDACVAGGGCNGYRPDDEGWGGGDRAVINVTWDDARAYVAWLSKTTGEDYRLLSEAEWEYATRAGTTTPFSTGKSITTDQANFHGDYTYNGSRRGMVRGQTTPAGTFEANPFGLHDLHGNVWEWVEDCWNDSYRKAPTDGSARTTGDCSGRVLRGGSWFDAPSNLRSGNRIRGGAWLRHDGSGFRVARTLKP
jgi:formylglycine-generating enzyme required for sulfatase activity